MIEPREIHQPTGDGHSPRDARPLRADRQRLARAVQSSFARRVVIASSCALLIGAAYLVFAPIVLSGYLRQAAARAGMDLTFASVSTLYPGDLRIEAPQLRMLAADVTLSARSLEARLRWHALFGDEPPIDVVRASDVELSWAGGSLGTLDLELRVSGDSSADGSGWMSLEGPRTTLTTPSRTIDFSLRTRLELQRWSVPDSGPFQVRLGDGLIEASDIASRSTGPSDVPAEKRGHTALRALLRVEAGRFAAPDELTLLGRVHVKGADAGVGLDWANADAGARWMLAELIGQPFELEAALQLCGAGLTLDDIRLETGLTQGTGVLRSVGDESRGALVLRRGSLSVGVRLLPGGAQALLSPEPGWLVKERSELDRPCAAATL